MNGDLGILKDVWIWTRSSKPNTGVEAAEIVIVKCFEQIFHQAQTTLHDELTVECQLFADVIEG